MTTAAVKSLAPILVVDAIEPCLPFWQAVGFQAGMTVPDQAPYVFAIVSNGGIEIMLQTRASVREDTPAVAENVTASILYISVASLEPILAALSDAPVVVARRTTFYGADEISFLDPAGNVIGFAAPAPAA